MGKGSGRRPSLVTDEKLLDNWERIFKSKPNESQFNNGNGAAIEQHKSKVAWRDEMVQEQHDEHIRKKNGKNVSNSVKSEKAKK